MRTNTAVHAPKVYTHEGAQAARINDIQQLRRSVMANMLWEGEFYESGESIAKRIQGLVADIAKTKDGPQQIADIAYEARTKMKLRHVPLLLIVGLIRARTDAARAVVADTILRVVQRPDEMGELVAIYWKTKAAGEKKMLPAQMKKGLAAALGKFDEYSLAKYDGEAAVKLRDVLFLAHAKPKDEAQAALWARVASRTLETPDTWEVALSSGADKKETFTRLIEEKKLGALALLRNLRNMIGAGVDEKVVSKALAEMNTERVLPFRFISAAKYAPTLEQDLELAMFRTLAGQPTLPGRTALLIDCSGSMTAVVSAKSEVTRKDAAAALGMILREVCEKVHVIAFASEVALVPPRRGFALRDAVNSYNIGYGTDTAAAMQMAKQQGYDRVIVITDEQSATPPGGPGDGKIGYFVNVASAQNGIGYGPWIHIDGWSEAILDYIREHEATLGVKMEEPVPA